MQSATCVYHRGLDITKHTQSDISMLIMELTSLDSSSSLPLPKSCVMASRSRVSSFVTCSALLAPGHYAILPLAFGHWNKQGTEERVSDLSYVLALSSARGVVMDGHVTTQPGFLAESIFHLAHKSGTVMKVL